METTSSNTKKEVDMSKLEKQKDDIMNMLRNDNLTSIVLVGDAGIGKTWMAREIRARAIREGLCYETIWVSMNIKHDERSLLENVAQQLDLHSTFQEWENDDGKVEEEEDLNSLRQRISAKLEEEKSAMREGKKWLLLILDDEGNKMDKKDVINEFSKYQDSLKVLIFRRKNDEAPNTHSEEIETEPLMIERFSDIESEILLRKIVQNKLSSLNGFVAHSATIAKKCAGLPAAINVMAEAFNFFEEHNSGGSSLEAALDYAVNNSTPILRLAYDMLPSDVMINCFWHSVKFFGKFGGVHYNELIAHWIIEGYFCPFDHIEKAYEEGHCVLMELIDRGLLKIQEANVVVVEGAMLSMIDPRRRGFAGTASLGLPSVLEDDKWNLLQRITWTDGMIKTLCGSRKEEKVSTVLIDGNRFCREVPQTFFHGMEGLKVLSFLYPRLKMLPQSLSHMANLLVLVLRSCKLLEDVTCIGELKTLIALEISGANSLEGIPEDFFEQMPQLRSLNLCGLQIKTLPSSLSNLTELQWLILSQCSGLTTVPILRALKNLEMIDLSGAASFKKFQDKNIDFLQNLRMLDLSDTQIEKLPILHNLSHLTRLLLRGCKCLTKLRNLQQLSCLQVLDLTDAIMIKEIQDDSFENKESLKILDLSGTGIGQLPVKLGNISYLNLSGCLELQKVPSLMALIDLESLDLSDAVKFENFEDESFEHLEKLSYLNLSNTMVKDLPSLSNLSNLRKVLLKGCTLLKILPTMEGLMRLEVLDLSGCKHMEKLPPLNVFKKLEVLDLSDCSSLKVDENESLVHSSCLRELNLDQCGATSLSEIAANSLEQLTHLQILKLFGIMKDIPSFSNVSELTNLSQLSLKGCSGLKNGQPLEVLSKLEVLDLSGTAFESLPSLGTFSSLRQLFLRDCLWVQELPTLKSFIHLEILDLWGTQIKEFPYEIAELTCLKHLDLPSLKTIQVDWTMIKCLPAKVNWEECDLSPSVLHADCARPSITVNDTNIFLFLEKDPNFWKALSKQLYLSVCLVDKQAKGQDAYCLQNQLLLGNIYFQTRHFPYSDKNNQCLEIHGSAETNGFPDAIRKVLMDAEYISLVENASGSCSSALGTIGVKNMKGCWLESCTEMKSIFCGDKGDVELGANLEILWISNLSKLESVYRENVRLESFQNLKCLHLDCIPALENLFPPSQMPVNLEVLQIRFCDKLRTLFKRDESCRCTLEKLGTLHLLELPKLTKIGIRLPSLEKFDVRECPQLKDTKEDLKLGSCACGKC
ncbi:putative disease resistance protein [Tripterygium wilfordii]|uniref:Putative disease resistance protein n=1 Tax=Tripterygium wilfordii TaxID=458696 RepID=A0A7J7CPJ1_TRIWF|nr:putative disease resistance protein At4g19050 [Tripterygium wilfordii]KAF5735816.1 putative disease resistance protein [Tripterygium wilfordii]